MVAARYLLVLLLFCIPVFAQELNEVVQVDLVDLYVTATDNKGLFVTDLKLDDLFVTENGVPQKIERFGAFAGERAEIPLLLAMVIDNSGSMDWNVGEISRLDLSKQAAQLLIDQLGPLDRMMLVSFSDTPIITELTQDREKVSGLVRNVRIVWTQTALFDSLSNVIQELNKNFGRKVLLLCSDGQDNISHTRFKDFIDTAAGVSDLTVVILGVGATNAVVGGNGSNKDIPDIPYLRSREYLQNLADRTAGFAYFPQNQKDVTQVLDRIRSYIRSQYYVAYHSTNNSKGQRQIEIKARRKGLTLHYRKSYSVN